MEFRLPELGEGVYEAEAVRWLVNVGQAVKHGQGLLEVLTDKATMEVPAPFTGVIGSLAVSPGQKIAIGQPILSYAPDAAGQPAVASASETKTTNAPPTPSLDVPASTTPPDHSHVRVAPSVRQLARQLGVELENVHGTGPDQRILEGDVRSAAGSKAEPKKHAGPPMSTKPAASEYGTPGTRIPFIGVRRKIAERLVHSKQTSPHFTYVDECDVTDVVRIKESLKNEGVRRGVKVTFLPFFLKAVAVALRQVPLVNAMHGERANEIVLHKDVNVSIAVATPTGLIVPVIRHVDQKSLFEVAAEAERVATDARAGKSRLEDLKDGTFSVTSIGGVGGLFATPVLNYPQVGILGIGKIVRRPIFDANDRVVPAHMIYLSFTMDHRIIDGAVAAAFGNAVIASLAKPMDLLLD